MSQRSNYIGQLVERLQVAEEIWGNKRLNLPGREANSQFLLVRGQPGHMTSLVGEIESRHATVVLVVGEPGIGKTSLIISLLKFFEQSSSPLPVLFEMSRWPGLQHALSEQQTVLGGEVMERLSQEGELCFLFDALDEVPRVSIDDAIDEVTALGRRFPRCPIVITCRTAAAPDWLLLRSRSLILPPLSLAEAEAALGEDHVTAALPPSTGSELIELARNPLILRMIVWLAGNATSAMQVVQSKGALYDAFLRGFIRREAAKGPRAGVEKAVSDGLHLELLTDLAWFLYKVKEREFDELVLHEWLASDDVRAKLGREFGAGDSPPLADIGRFLVTHPPLTQRTDTLAVPFSLRFRFLHPSFPDFLVAKRLSTDWLQSDKGDAATTTLTSYEAIGGGVLLSYAVGLVPAPSELVNSLIHVAIGSADQQYIQLAAECVRDRWDMASETADDVLMWVLDAFKNWGLAFDYQLMRTAASIVGRTSQDFPARLSRDLRYFADKYAMYVPVEIVGVGERELWDLVQSSADRQITIDAIHTLGRLAAKDSSRRQPVIDGLVDLLSHSGDGPALETTISTLKDLRETALEEVFENVLQSGVIGDRGKAFALNGLAEVGGVDKVDVVIGFLHDMGFRYRDSASWSLLILAGRLQSRYPEVLSKCRGAYSASLNRETENGPGVYALGNVLYSIGKLSLRELHLGVKAWVTKATDAYVREDAIYGLGFFGRADNIPLFKARVRDEDPVVVMKAIDGLRTAEAWTCRSLVAELRSHRYAVIREAAVRFEDAYKSWVARHAAEIALEAALKAATLSNRTYALRVPADQAATMTHFAEQLFAAQRIKVRPQVKEGPGFTEVIMTEETYDRLSEVVRSATRHG